MAGAEGRRKKKERSGFVFVWQVKSEEQYVLLY